MGLMQSPNYCFITGLITENHVSDRDAIEYYIDLNGRRVLLRFSPRFQRSTFISDNIHIFHGLIMNNIFPDENFGATGTLLNEKRLIAIINESNFPESPTQKIENLLLYLHSLQIFEGSRINYPEGLDRDFLAQKLYFRHYQEMVFYLFTLLSQGLIDGNDASSANGDDLIDIKLTFEGLATVIDLQDSGQSSLRCFVAMSFSDELLDTRESIKRAIRESGYDPVLIDEIDIDADVTINDAIIAEIRKCRFLVSDFTQHKHGVYFEAGFALGLGRPVIYTCHEDDFANSHFDTNHYPHIIYGDLDDLQTKLINKINAWIT